MAALTNKQVQELENILNEITTTKKFVLSPRIQICTTTLPDSLSFYNKEGLGITPITKEAGSDLCYLYKAEERLRMFIAHHRKTA